MRCRQCALVRGQRLSNAPSAGRAPDDVAATDAEERAKAAIEGCALETSPGILAALPVTLELHSMYMYARGQVEEGHQSRKRNDAGEVTPPPSPRSPSVSPKTISLDCPNGATGQTEGAGQSAGGGARARGRTDASALAKLEIFECGASVRSRPRPSFLPI